MSTTLRSVAELIDGDGMVRNTEQVLAIVGPLPPHDREKARV